MGFRAPYRHSRHDMFRAALGEGPAVQAVAGYRGRDVARLIAAIERGDPAEAAIAVVGIDRAVAANRVLQALGIPACHGGEIHLLFSSRVHAERSTWPST
jgi:hypothetical protein